MDELGRPYCGSSVCLERWITQVCPVKTPYLKLYIHNLKTQIQFTLLSFPVALVHVCCSFSACIHVGAQGLSPIKKILWFPNTISNRFVSQRAWLLFPNDSHPPLTRWELKSGKRKMPCYCVCVMWCCNSTFLIAEVLFHEVKTLLPI